MSRKGRTPGRLIPLVFFTFVAGGALGWWLHASYDGATESVQLLEDRATIVGAHDVALEPPADQRAPSMQGSGAAGAVDELRRRRLAVPVAGAEIADLRGQFGQRRGGGSRGHEAVDILAPRHTPVHAVEDGTIAKLFESRLGGITIYQFDPEQRYCYYYAHLERYADDLHEGQSISRGEVIGFVGTSGNAPANTPHLHFAIFELTKDRRWWEGTALDPYPVFSR